MQKVSRLLNAVAVIAATSLMNGCASSNATPYADNQSPFTIQDYFNGHIKAHGIVLNRQGQLKRTFSINMHGQWHATQGVLQEVIHYNDGKAQTRAWHFTTQDPHHFTATSADAVGVATGTQYGNAVHMTYTLNVPVDQSVYELNFDDWLYKLPDGKVINRTLLSKFGINVSEIIITYDKK
jgi:hypothetical protein